MNQDMAIDDRLALSDRARSASVLIDSFAEFADNEGRLAPEVVDAFHRLGLFEMWVPRELGGSELDPLASLDTLALTASACSSAGWVLLATGLSTAITGAYLHPDATAEMWRDGKHPVVAGQGTRAGVATPAKGGFRLTGSWSFGSGILHATHALSLGTIETTGESRVFVVPIECVTLLGNWDVMGLRGTGSVDYAIDDVYVPEEFTAPAAADQPLRGGALYRIGAIGFTGIGHSGWAVGVGQRVLQELRQLVIAKANEPGSRAGDPAFHAAYARAEAQMRAARSLVYEAWEDAARALDRGDELSVRQTSVLRLALCHATSTLNEVANFAYLAGGTTALRSGRLQLLTRDVHAGTQHVTSGPAVLQAAGRELAGLATGMRWMMLRLVPTQA